MLTGVYEIAIDKFELAIVAKEQNTTPVESVTTLLDLETRRPDKSNSEETPYKVLECEVTDRNDPSVKDKLQESSACSQTFVFAIGDKVETEIKADPLKRGNGLLSARTALVRTTETETEQERDVCKNVTPKVEMPAITPRITGRSNWTELPDVREI